MTETARTDKSDMDPGDLARNHYENFPLATPFMPSGLRVHIRRLYAFARTVDDLGDEASGDRLQRLEEWEEDFMCCYTGSPDHAVLKELQETIEEFELPSDPFLRLIEANRRDQRIHRYETFDDLLEYCTYSANPCGRLFLRVCGHDASDLLELSDYTCTALQLTNFWQDVGDDLDRDRIYLPLEDLRRFQLSPEDLYRFHAGTRTPPESFYELMDFQTRRTKRYFSRGLELVPEVSSSIRFDVLLFTVGGVSVLEKLQKKRYPVFEGRVTINGMARLGFFLKAGWLLLTGGINRYREQLREGY